MVKKELLKCFVIMPFSKSSDNHTDEYWNKHFTDFLTPLIESSHVFKAVRSEALRGDILRQIITDLVTAPLVVADLTDANPNVYWELGVRQSFKHSTITIAEHGTELPFDLTTKGTLFYYTGDHIKIGRFQRQFLTAIADCHENPEFPDSYVLEAISGRGTLYQILMRDESLRRLDALLSEITSNKETWDIIIKTCNENIKQRSASPKGKISYSTKILIHCCIDLLISTRYLSATPKFYSIAEIYLGWVMSINERLPHWPTRGEAIEDWLQAQAEGMTMVTKKLESLVQQQKEAISVIQ
jgi:hypothetical protein